MKIIETIKLLIPINSKLVSDLYAISEKSLLAVLTLNILITFFLLPIIGNILYLWTILFFLLIIYRFILSYHFKNHIHKLSLNEWYINFVITALATASFMAVLPLFLLPYPDEVLVQLLVVMLVVGYASGSLSALVSDIRIAVSYVLVLILPLIGCLIYHNSELYTILSLFLFIHMLALILILWENYKQQNKMLLQERKIANVIQKLDNKQNLLNHFVEESPLAIFSCDVDLIIIDVNKTLITLMKRTKEEIVGMDIHTLPNQYFVETIEKAIAEGSSQYSGEYRSIHGINLWVEIIFLARYNAAKEIIGVMALIHDKTKEHNAIAKLQYTAIHDELTNLLNRRGFLRSMSEQINIGRQKKRYSILFYLDLNQFKVINDSLGHAIGDMVLIEVAKRLKKLILKECIISRFGGDEFVLLIPKTSQSYDESVNISTTCAQAIQNIFLEPFVIEEMHLQISSSLGVVILAPNEIKIENILRHADLTMYRAKKTKNHISYYDSSLDEKQKELFVLQHDLSYAIQNDELRLYLQPIVNIEDDSLYASELLIRWEHPQKGLLSPEMFIPLAIKAGILSKITWWILDEVCQQIKKWKKEDQWKLNYISINVNAKQLMEKDFVSILLKKLEKYSVHSSDIVLEITERSLIDNFGQTQKVVLNLQSYGILCAIDDFGVGYSSLSYLQKLSCSILKIDRSFVEYINDNNKEIVLLSTIINIGKQFGYKIVIEGIEREAQKDVLSKLDSSLLYQGYFFSKPLDIDSFTQKFLN